MTMHIVVVGSFAHSSFTCCVFAWALLFLCGHRVTIHYLQDVIQPSAVNEIPSCSTFSLILPHLKIW